MTPNGKKFLIAGRVFPKRQLRVIEHEVFFQILRQPLFPLHTGYDGGLLGHGGGLREPAALRVSGGERPEKLRFSTT